MRRRMNHVPIDPDYEPKKRKPGAGWLISSSLAALSWAGFASFGICARYGLDGLLALTPTDAAGLAGVVIGPSLMLLFAGAAAREAARARAQSQEVVDIAGRLRVQASHGGAQAAAESSRTLRTELIALDGVVRAAGQRIDHFRETLQQDGSALAYALKADIEAMRAVRAELAAEGKALTGLMDRNLDTMRQASAHMAREVETFGAAFAQIGARSAEFAAAAEAGKTSAEVFDRAVHKALQGLAHATSLNECARKSVLESTTLATEAARALDATTTRAIHKAREAAREIRAGAPPATQAHAFAESFSGRHDPSNIDPAPTKLAGVFDLLRLKPAKRETEVADEPLPVPANDHKRPRATLADIVRLTGLRAGQALSPRDLARIARAGAAGPDARREATWIVASDKVRQISTHLRRHADARRAAEILRRDPQGQLGEGSDAANAHELTSAYLLVDAALG